MSWIRGQQDQSAKLEWEERKTLLRFEGLREYNVLVSFSLSCVLTKLRILSFVALV